MNSDASDQLVNRRRSRCLTSKMNRFTPAAILLLLASTGSTASAEQTTSPTTQTQPAATQPAAPPRPLGSDLADLDARTRPLRFAAVDIQYVGVPAAETAALPPVQSLLDQTVTLARQGKGDAVIFVAGTVRDSNGRVLPRADIGSYEIPVIQSGGLIGDKVGSVKEQEVITVRIGDLGSLPTHRFSVSAIRSIADQIVSQLNANHLIGIYVVPSEADVIAAQEAAKSNDKPVGPLHLEVHVGVVKSVRTVEVGDRKPDADAKGNKDINNAASENIRKNSPIHPGGAGLVRKDLLDDYVAWLNRQPARHVDAAITPDKDGVGLDYLVSHAKPWTIFTQLSNTGTSQTSKWRERFGFIHNNLSGNGDILSLDYSTANFDESHQVSASYDTPLAFMDLDHTRNKIYAAYSQYTASDVGQNSQSFTGDSELVGDELVQNIFQRHDLFIDAVGGFRFQHSHVSNSTLDLAGSGDFYMPYGGLRLDKSDELNTLQADATVLGSFTNADMANRDQLGRVDTDSSWVILQGDALYSFYLEPLLDQHAFEDGKSSLAHEIVLSTKWQVAFDQRLTPDQQQVVGGLYTVRGYPESATAGDSAFIASAEYRFHLPRVFDADRTPAQIFGEPFHWVPPQTYGRPDWDFVPRLFVDAGQVANSKGEPYEQDATLVGAGVGVDLQVKQNLNVRVDWGIALEPLNAAQSGGNTVDRNSNRFSFVFTLSY